MGRCRPGALAPTVRHFGQGGALTSSAVFLVFSYICLIVYFETFYSSCIYFFSPYVGKCGREVEGELTHTPLVGHAGSPNTDGCDASCTKPDIGLLPCLEGFLLSPPLRPLLLSSPPFGGVGGLGAPPFVFLSFSFPFFLPPLVRLFTLKLEKGSRVRADSG